MSFPRGHTPTLKLRAKQDVDLSQIAHIYVTLKQGSTKIRKQDDELQVEDRVISVYLNQKESLSLYKGEANVMINWTYPDGRRGGNSKPIKIWIEENLEG